MTDEIVTILFDQLLLIEGLLLGVALSVLLLRRRYLLKRRRHEADREQGPDARAAPAALAPRRLRAISVVRIDERESRASR